MKTFIEKIPLYPFLTAVYPILFLLSVNVEEVGPAAGYRSGLVLLLFSMVTIAITFVMTRDINTSALTSFVITLIFFLIFFVFYAPAYRTLREVKIFGETIGRHRYLISTTFVFLVVTGVLMIWVSKKLKKRAKSITQALNLIIISLVLIPSITIISYQIREDKIQAQAQTKLPLLDQSIPSSTANLPDIYYLIFDMHTSDAVMRQLLNYDNSAYTTALEERGFYVAPCSRSNYGTTQFSITSSLNMNYLQEMTDSFNSASLYPLFQSSLVQRTLEGAGYQIFAFETGYKFTELLLADNYLYPGSNVVDLLTYPGLTTFESLVMQVSGGKILYESRDQIPKNIRYIIDAPYVEYRDRILFTLETLPDLATEPGPKFVFAHILAPHDPFVFDEDGSPAFRRTPFSMDKDPEFGKGYGWEPYSEGYIKEIKYLHSRILEVVDTLHAKSTTPPVIIIQGDHGIPRTAHRNAQYEIYNAIYLGGNEIEGIYSTISPVNNFRVIFNQLFGTGYQVLPDESYYLDEDSGKFLQSTGTFTCP